MACGGTRGPRPRPRDEQRRHPLERHRQYRVAVDLHRAMPQARAGLLLKISRLSTVILAAPLLLIAVQGYSVLYLFLLADLVCAAATFPIVYGLYSARYTGRAAILGTLAALLVGGLLFPDPAM